MAFKIFPTCKNSHCELFKVEINWFLTLIFQEIVPLRKVCRRPETDYRLQQLHAVNEAASAEQQKSSMDSFAVNALRASIPAETIQKLQNTDAASTAPVLPASALLTSQASVLDPKKTETSNVVDAGNSNTAPPAGNPVTSGSLISNSPVLSGDNMLDSKNIG